jgi:hypothetical protein
MNGARPEWEHPQLRDLRAEFLSTPALRELALTGLGEATPRFERVCIRTDSQSVDLALARALALSVAGIFTRVELT